MTKTIGNIKLEAVGKGALALALSATLALGTALPPAALAHAAASGDALAAQAASEIGIAEVTHPLVWAGDTEVAFSVNGTTEGFTTAYYEDDEGSKGAAHSGPFEEGAAYVAELTGDGVAFDGARLVSFTASGAVDMTDNWSFQVADVCAYTGNPVELQVSYSADDGSQYDVDPSMVSVTFYDAEGAEVPAAQTSACGYYGYVITGDGSHFTGSIGTADMPRQAFVYEPVDLDRCSIADIADIPYTGYPVMPSLDIAYPDGYASAGEQVDMRLYDLKFYDAEGSYLGDWEYPVEVGTYTVKVEGVSEYSCTGSCEATFSITDDKVLPSVHMVLADGTLSYSASYVETGSNPAIAYRVGSFEDDDFVEVDPDCYDVVVVDSNGNAVEDYSAVGSYTVRATGKNGYVGTSCAVFNVTAKPVERPISDQPAASKPAVAKQTMHRLYNPYSGEHFYTADASEKNHLVSVGWRYEGVGWQAPTSGEDVYRLYNPYAGDHHYTKSASERDHLVSVGWRYEGVGWKSGGSTPLYRQYNPYAEVGTHNYTTSKSENDHLVSVGWRAEGVGWYGMS